MTTGPHPPPTTTQVTSTAPTTVPTTSTTTPAPPTTTTTKETPTTTTTEATTSTTTTTTTTTTSSPLPPTTTTKPTTTTSRPVPTHPGPYPPGPHPPGPHPPGPHPPGPHPPGPHPPGPHPPGPHPPGPPTVRPPAPITKPPPPSHGDRPVCHNCSPFDISITRIVGGVEAGIGEFPFQARIDIEGVMCSGSLITPTDVLTAAHCFQRTVSSVRVILGDHNLDAQEPYSVTIRAPSVITHKDFDSVSMNNDVAVLKLEYPVRFTKFIAPICLATPRDTFDSKVAVASGWGHTTYSGSVSKNLQKVVLDIITNDECQDLYNSKYTITENMICTYTVYKDACQGDSGGPLVRKASDGKWLLYGITSFGYKCAEKNSPGIFTKVDNYIDWIKEKIGHVQC